MRRVQFDAPRGAGPRLVEVARRERAETVTLHQVESPRGPRDVVTVEVANDGVEALLRTLSDVEGLRVSFEPHGLLALESPAGEPKARDITARSAAEVYLAGLQSVGAWTGFLGYALAAGVIVWIALFTNTVYLLVAAMLLAPFAGPAMVTAIATARGDARLLGRGLARYAAALAIAVGASAGLSLLMGQRVASVLMVDVSSVSTVTVLLPLVGGAAGALNLVQSERTSLVSGAAVGMLIAVSIAPPAGVLGMALVMREWGMAHAATFLLVLQLVAIHVAGTAVFLAYRVTPSSTPFVPGSRAVTAAALLVSAAAVGGLVAYQLQDEPALQRSTLEQRASALVSDAVGSSDVAHLVEANARFTRSDVPGQHSLLVVAYVQPRQDGADPAVVAAQVRQAIEARLLAADLGATPLVDVTVLASPQR